MTAPAQTTGPSAWWWAVGLGFVGLVTTAVVLHGSSKLQDPWGDDVVPVTRKKRLALLEVTVIPNLRDPGPEEDDTSWDVVLTEYPTGDSDGSGNVSEITSFVKKRDAQAWARKRGAVARAEGSYDDVIVAGAALPKNKKRARK